MPPSTPRSAQLRLPLSQRLFYSIGHILNDLTASMWFSYMVIYFHQVKDFNNGLSGDLVLIGQVSDALFTPFIGYESDRVRGLCNMGKRKTWHLIGTICVACSFPFLFVDCITCSHAADLAQFLYYAPFVIIFQFGWASVQISHLSLIPDLSSDEHERVEMNGMRYAFTVLSNMAVYAIAWLLFELHSSSGGDQTRLNASDVGIFRELVLIVVGIGLVFSIIFHLGVRENAPANVPKSGKDALLDESSVVDTVETSLLEHETMTWKCWLKEHQFYQVALIYMSTRLVVNVSQVYLPMYITETLECSKQSVATIPLVVYLSGFLTSLLMRFINKLAGRKVTYALGAFVAIAACVWMYFIPKGSPMNYESYGAAALLGIGGSTMLVTSLAMTADLIKNNTESGAFVYGAMSFTDKLSNGAAVLLIQQFHPCLNCCPKCVRYYRYIVSFVPGGFTVLALIVLLTLISQTIGTRRKKLKAMSPVLNSERKIRQANGYGTITKGESDGDGEEEPLIVDKRGSINS